MGCAGDVANCREVKALINLRLVFCLVNGNVVVGVRVSFLMVDHVQKQGIFLIAEIYIYTWVNALVTCILFP